MAATYNIGIIGYGFSAKVFNLPFIMTTPGLNLYAIVQRQASQDNDAAKDFPGVKIYRKVQDLVEDSALDAIVVTSTPNVHYEHAKLALLHGKSVIVEKPFVPTFEEARELVALAKKQNLLLSVYQNRRFDTDFITIQRLLHEGALGRVVEFESHVDRYTPLLPDSWKGRHINGGGAIYDLGSHLFDQIVFLFGLPRAVTAFIGTQRSEQDNPDGFDDFFTAYLQYENGLTATVKTNIVSPEVRYLRFWVRGTKGTYLKHHLDIQETQLQLEGISPVDSKYAQEPKENSGILQQVQSDGSISCTQLQSSWDVNWRTFFSTFKKALDGDCPVPVAAEIPAQVIRLIELAKQSSQTGKTVLVQHASAGFAWEGI